MLMKKVLSLIMVVLLVLSFSISASADTVSKSDKVEESTETKEFDPSAFQNSELYTYDKFQKKWNIQGAYVKEYSNYTFYFGVLLFDSYVSNEWGPELRVEGFDKTTGEFDSIKALRVLVDDVLYSFEALEEGDTNSYAFGGNVIRSLLNALKGAKEVALQFEAYEKNGRYHLFTIEDITSEDLNELIEMADLLENSHAWGLDKTPDKSDNYYKASVKN